MTIPRIEPSTLSPYLPTAGEVAPASSPKNTQSTLQPAVIEWRLLNFLRDLENAGVKVHTVSLEDMQRLQEKFQKLTAERKEKMQTLLNEKKSNYVWSLFKKIGKTLLSAVSFIFGLALTATPGGAVVGGAMVVSGVLSISNLAASEAGVWNWVSKKIAKDNKDKENLALMIPAVIDVATGAIGFIGSAGTMIYGNLQLPHQILTAVQMGVRFTDMTTTIGKGQSDAKVNWAKADIEDLKTEFKLNDQNVDQLITQMQTFAARQAQSQSIFAKMIQNSKKAIS